MNGYRLPHELISLVHHIELNKAGWWDKNIQQLIFVVIWLANENLTVDGVSKKLKSYFNVDITKSQLEPQLKALCLAGRLIRVEGCKHKIAESTLREFEKDLVKTEQLENDVKREFCDYVSTHCPSLDFSEVWSSFHEHFLIPFFRGNGAKIYELLTGTENRVDVDTFFPDFLEQYPSHIHNRLRDAVYAFLDPNKQNVRSYILRYLNAYFFLVSTNLREDTLKALEKTISMLPTFVVLVDTNCLFLILSLDENPSNEAALRLIELLRKLPKEIKLQLYVLQITMDESKRVLIARQSDLRDIKLWPNLAQATVNMDLDGITCKFLEEYRKSPSTVEAESYFNPYINSLITICRSKGVELFNESIVRLKTDQRVIDDILDQQDYEKSHYGDHAKDHRRLEHDMILWHFVHNKRAVGTESPLHAKYWVVTVDKRFLRFDTYKGRQLKNAIPICLHPTTLVQMLQFWVPRTPIFEEAILSSIRLPFLVQKFDLAAERVTLKILQAMGRFENIGDLPPDSVTSILLNDALRQKLSQEGSIDKQTELVKEVLIEEHKKLGEKVKVVSSKAKRLEKEKSEKDKVIAGLQKELENVKEDAQVARTDATSAKDDRDKLKKQVDILGKRISNMESTADNSNKQRYRRRFVVKWVLMTMLFLLIGTGIAIVLEKVISAKLWKLVLIMGSATLIFSFWQVDRDGQKHPHISKSSVFTKFHRFSKWIFGILGVFGLAILANAVYDFVKNISK